jgi:hypothetical protein
LSTVEKAFSKSLYLLLISAKSTQRPLALDLSHPPKINNDPTLAPGIVYFADIDNSKALRKICLAPKIRAIDGDTTINTVYIIDAGKS